MHSYANSLARLTRDKLRSKPSRSDKKIDGRQPPITVRTMTRFRLFPVIPREFESSKPKKRRGEINSKHNGVSAGTKPKKS